MKKEYFKPQVVSLELSAMDCLMVSGFADMPQGMPQPAPNRSTSAPVRNTLIVK